MVILDFATFDTHCHKKAFLGVECIDDVPMCGCKTTLYDGLP